MNLYYAKYRCQEDGGFDCYTDIVEYEVQIFAVSKEKSKNLLPKCATIIELNDCGSLRDERLVTETKIVTKITLISTDDPLRRSVVM